MDLPSLALSNNQNALIAAVAAANPHTVVVIESGSPVTMPWVEARPRFWKPGTRARTAPTPWAKCCSAR